MIELKETKVLRIRYEEFDSLVEEHSSKVQMGESWLAYYMNELYPHWFLHQTFDDYRSEHVYVILVREPVITYMNHWIDEKGKVHIEELVD